MTPQVKDIPLFRYFVTADELQHIDNEEYATLRDRLKLAILRHFKSKKKQLFYKADPFIILNRYIFQAENMGYSTESTVRLRTVDKPVEK